MQKIPSISELKKTDFSQLLDPDFQKKLGLSATSQTQFYLFIKRLIDIALSLAALIIFAPIWLLIIILIRLDSKGPAIFCHERVGKNGKIFKLYKFRTMHQGVKDQEFAPESSQDPRITKIGSFLRKTSLDEVPQFWNVIKGEMSLVGPRPEMSFIVQHYTQLQKCRLLVKPGLTGLWQIYGRKDLPLQENIEFDFYYILNRSLLMDLMILFKTITVVIKGTGAY